MKRLESDEGKQVRLVRQLKTLDEKHIWNLVDHEIPKNTTLEYGVSWETLSNRTFLEYRIQDTDSLVVGESGKFYKL